MADFAGVRLLVFRVGHVRCAAEAAAVREIMSPQPVTRVPGAPEQVPGVINVRGSLVTLVDARQCLLGSSAHNGEGPLVLVDFGSRTVALVVDEVIDLISVPRDALAERAELPGVEARFVRAVGRQAQQSFALLDTDALFEPILPS